ncbi:MAG TPA: hypothetical protein VGM10_28940 [Actinocrinis sp.]|jgi:hypothetical protein
MSDLETGSKLRQVSDPEELGHAPVDDLEGGAARGTDDIGGSSTGSDATAQTLAITTAGDSGEVAEGAADGEGAFGADPALLAAPPVDGGLAAALAPKPERPKMTRATAGLAAAALLCVGFLGGVLVERHYAGTSSPAASASSSPGGSSGGHSTVTGTVTAVNGNTIYVTAPDGTVYTITASGSTTVSVTQIGGITDLRPGQSVTIKGTNTGQGTFSASSITASGYGSGGQGQLAPTTSASQVANPGASGGVPTGGTYPTNISIPQGTDFPTDSLGQ